MNIHQSTAAMDISLMAFEMAVGHIRAEPDKVTLYCPHACVCVAQKIKDEYRCEVVLIPDELAINKYCWAVIGNDSMYWAPGVP